MPRIRTLQRSFVGGVISPALWGQVENTRRLTGAEIMENMVPLPQGKLAMRPGTAFVHETADSAKASVLRPFGAGASTSFTVGFEEARFRFYFDGAVVLWGTSRLVASVNTTAETIAFTAPHGFTSNQAVKLVRPSTSTSPTGLDTLTTYYVIVVNSTTIQVSASAGPGAAVNITGAGSGALYFFEVADLPRNYVASKNVSAVNAGTEAVTVTAHGLTTGDPVEFTSEIAFTAATTDICTAAGHNIPEGTPVTVSSSGTLPGGLTAGVTYYVHVLTANTFNLLTAYSGPFIAPVAVVDITSTGSGTHTLSVATGGVVVGATPSVTVGTTYYARVSDADNFFLFTTAAGAISGVTDGVNITSASLIGTLRFHYAYQHGDLTNFPNSGIYYSEQDHQLNSAPGTASWYLLPFTGEYEIPNPYDDAELPYIQYRQQGDTMRLAHPAHQLYDLEREAETRWTLTAVPLTPPIDPPTSVSVEQTYGEYVINSFSNASPAVFTSPTPHGYSAGTTTVYMDSISGTLTNAPAGYYIVATRPTDTTFTLKFLAAGGAVNSTSTGAATTRRAVLSTETVYSYFVTAVTKDGVESIASNEVAVANNLSVDGSYNTIYWSAVSGAERYRVYKTKNGLDGFIGETIDLTFRDDNIGPDLNYTPPRVDTSIGTSPDFPGVIAVFEQRDVLSGVTTDPQRIWFTALGTDTFLIYHIPVIDTDRIDLTLESAVKHIVPMQNLVVLTENIEFVLTTVDSDAITPSDFRARPVSYVGSSYVKPVTVNDRLVFAANRGGHIFEFLLRAAFEGYKPNDLCIYAPHLFDGYTIVDMALQKAPFYCLWVVRSDGALLGLTYLPEEEVVGWHLHTTQGQFESICVVAEGTEDRIYAVVKRTINSQTKRYVERFATFAAKTIRNAFHVDCGLSYSGASTRVFTGFEHLEAAEVAVNYGTGVQLDLTVSSGTVTLNPDAISYPESTTAQIGLGYTGLFRSLPVVATADTAMVQGRLKDPGRAGIRTVDSGTYFLGLTDDELEQVPAGTVGELTNGEELIKLPNSWTESGQVYIRQPYPLPLNVISLSLDFDLGGV